MQDAARSMIAALPDKNGFAACGMQTSLSGIGTLGNQRKHLSSSLPGTRLKRSGIPFSPNAKQAQGQVYQSASAG